MKVATSWMVAGSKIAMSAAIPGRNTPRSMIPTRLAASDVIFRIASSSRMACSWRTYLASTRGNVPNARGIRFGMAQRPILTPFRRVRSERDDRARDRGPRIGICHDVDHDLACAVVSDRHVHGGIARILSHRASDLGEGHPLVLRQRGIHDFNEFHACASARSAPLVLPRGVRRIHLALGPRALRRIRQALRHLAHSAFQDPGRKTRGEIVRRPRVGVHTRRDVDTARAGRRNAPKHLRHLAEVFAIGGLEMPNGRRDAGSLRDRRRPRPAMRICGRPPNADA